MTTLPSAKPKLKHKSGRIQMVAMESRIAPMAVGGLLGVGAQNGQHNTDAEAFSQPTPASTSVFKEFMKAFQGNKEEKK